MPNFKAQFGTNIAAMNGFLAALYTMISESQFFFVSLFIFVQGMSSVASLLAYVWTDGGEGLAYFKSDLPS